MNDKQPTSSQRSSCGCCEGVEKLTPMTTTNRPGLKTLVYRVGTHATFFETMKARLSSYRLETESGALGPGDQRLVDRVNPLIDLTTRESDDPAIALLDAWATVGDVLTFYQERNANEAYLRTATERRSVLELARLIGYALRPGVAASVYFALTLEKDHKIVLKRNELKAQSLPGPGELPQTFENSEELDARAVWNTLKPRTLRPQTQTTIKTGPGKNGEKEPRVYLKGISTNLKANDPLLLEFSKNSPELFRVMAVEADPLLDKTLVKLKPWEEEGFTEEDSTTIKTFRETIDELIEMVSPHSTLATAERARTLLEELRIRHDAGETEEVLAAHINDEILPELSGTVARLGSRSNVAAPLLNTVIAKLGGAAAQTEEGDVLEGVIKDLAKSPSVPPRNALNLRRDLETNFKAKSDGGLQLISAFQPLLRDSIPTTLKNASFKGPSAIRVYALRAKASPFGYNAPSKSEIVDSETKKTVTLFDLNERHIVEAEDASGSIVYLGASFDKILPGSWVVVDTSSVDQKKTRRVQLGPEVPILIAKTSQPKSNLSRTAYLVSGPTTKLDLVEPKDRKTPKRWISFENKDPLDEIEIIRKTVVYTESEELFLAEEPMDDPICDREIELDGLYSDLKSGRWLIISGERKDIKDPSGDALAGVTASELVMVAGVNHRLTQGLPGDQLHTFIELEETPAYCYKRDAVTIYANVVKANHGETRNEVLGSGDATKAFQSFTLRQPPLTYVASPTPAGAESTLKLFVNDVKWEQADLLAELGPSDRKFIARTDDEGKTTVVFGDGKYGARLPTGAENIRAIYRNGIGRGANVRAGQISLLMSRPLGVKEVINPLRASGGADKEARDQARKNAPLTVAALDRLISTEDYADFARTFAGISKSVAVRLSDGRRELVHVTIAGADDMPIDKSSDLFRNLTDALLKFGDPFQPLKVEMRELKFLFISARVSILPEYLWDPVVTNIRAKLLDTFSFERRELGQDALLSEVISAIQAVRGVAYIDVDVFGGVPEKKVDGKERRLLTPKEILNEIQTLTGPEDRVTVQLAGLEGGVINPAQLAYLTPEVPETLILNQI